MAEQFESWILGCFEKGAIKVAKPGEEGFPLSGGGKAPVYFNLRGGDDGPLTTADFESLGHELFAFAQLHSIEYDGVAGMPNAGSRIAEAFWAASKKVRPTGLVVLDKKVVDGNKTFTFRYGHIEPKARVLLIDDVISGGSSLAAGAKALTTLHFTVSAFLVAIDRRREGQDILPEGSPKVWAWGTAYDAISSLLAQGKISQEMAGPALAYFSSGQ